MASWHTTGHWQCPSSLHFPPVALDPSSHFTLSLPPLRNNLFLKTNLDYNPVWRPNSPWLCNPPASMTLLLRWQTPQACTHHELITQWIPRLKILRKSRSRFVYYNVVIWKIPFHILLTATDFFFKSRFISNKQFYTKIQESLWIAYTDHYTGMPLGCSYLLFAYGKLLCTNPQLQGLPPFILLA